MYNEIIRILIVLYHNNAQIFPSEQYDHILFNTPISIDVIDSIMSLIVFLVYSATHET